ncbi:MAG: hypothetical protein KBT27_15340 [Prevotellaceae bacterium]|nr:hypothetical protein [Candidatus Faecinaster equi]
MSNTKKSKVTEDVQVEVATPVKSVKKNKKFAPDDLIECRSVTHGELILIGKKSQLQYTWANQGDVTEVEFQDLQALYSTKSRFIVEPLFVIENEELLENWKSLLSPIYDKIVEADLNDMFKLTPSQLKKRLKSSPEGLRKSIMSMAAEKIVAGELDSISRIKAIDEALNTELMSMIN